MSVSSIKNDKDFESKYKKLTNPLPQHVFTKITTPIAILEKLIGCGVKPDYLYVLTKDIIPQSLQTYIYTHTINKPDITEINDKYVEHASLLPTVDAYEATVNPNIKDTKYVQLVKEFDNYKVKLNDIDTDKYYIVDSIPKYDINKIDKNLFPYDINLEEMYNSFVSDSSLFPDAHVPTPVPTPTPTPKPPSIYSTPPNADPFSGSSPSNFSDTSSYSYSSYADSSVQQSNNSLGYTVKQVGNASFIEYDNVEESIEMLIP